MKAIAINPVSYILKWMFIYLSLFFLSFVDVCFNFFMLLLLGSVPTLGVKNVSNDGVTESSDMGYSVSNA